MKSFKHLSLMALLAAALAVLLLTDLSLRLVRSTSAGAVGFGDRVIVIDAGHGGFDPGAVYGGVEEKNINLVIACRLRDLFTAAGYTVIMTRDTDCSTESDDVPAASRKASDIRARVAIAERYSDSVLISIHQNAFSDTAQHGTQVFYGAVHSDSSALAECIRLAVKTGLQPDNRREIKKGTGSIYILKNCRVPTVLVECGFISNPAERKKLLDEEYCRKLAFCIFCGYLQYESGTGG